LFTPSFVLSVSPRHFIVIIIINFHYFCWEVINVAWLSGFCSYDSLSNVISLTCTRPWNSRKLVRLRTDKTDVD
jgi:hypothetical protein